MQNNRDNLDGIISALLKPLLFASKDNFVRMDAVKDLERHAARLSAEALLLNPEDGKAKRFAAIGEGFAGFDALSFHEKKDKVLSAIEALESLSLPPRKSVPAVTAAEALSRLGSLKKPLEFVKGIGPALGARLKKKGLATVEDILYFLPIRYEDRSRIKGIGELKPGSNEVTVGTVLALGEVYYGRRRLFEMAVGDGGSVLKLKWFHCKPAYMKRYKAGQRLVIYGAVSRYGHHVEMIHPDIEVIGGEEGTSSIHFNGVIPIYSQVENFHQKTIRNIVRGAVDSYAPHLVGGVPGSVLVKTGFMPLAEAVRAAHLPSDGGDGATLRAKKSIAFDELFVLELGLALKRALIKKDRGVALAPSDFVLEKKLRAMLSFKLTRAQERVVAEVKKDMSMPCPMNRLIQGDVGSGKTIVSFIAALAAIEGGCQAALMAPTEILSEQHYLNIQKFAAPLGIRAALLTGGMGKSERKKALDAIKKGDTGLIIGTHALIQKDVEFKALGLVIIDEQHRFGVGQRAELKRKANGVFPHMLIMTATPIPTTLSMTVFGDLDVSIIDELPPGRMPVVTQILREKDRGRAYDLIRRELDDGSQAYIVYPLVEGSEELPLKDATNMKHHLEKDVFHDVRVGLLHGRMKPSEKESVMRGFKEKRLDVLVSTTVIEVGVDVPNATVMLVEHAERFGLSQQLHQLRGRVGRGDKRSICLLLSAWTNSDAAYKRLKVMENTMDGFKIAEEDLKLRGPGDFIGTRQAGLPDLRLSGALGDLALLKKAREEALRLFSVDPGLRGAEAECVKEVLKARWAGRLELAEIG
ncbi:MAG: ATP-dependent DNA helicase RecG [Deltaproteobacteria bacterium]|nr:ATP-dependent DNA helicase RecG [Deltaproteobacteria bacterium]